MYYISMLMQTIGKLKDIVQLESLHVEKIESFISRLSTALAATENVITLSRF